MSGIHIEGTLEIATGVPATFDKAGYEALTFVEVDGMIEAPTFASTHGDISIPLLKGWTKIRKGPETGVSSSIVYSSEAGDDAGQLAVLAACRARGEYSLRWTPPDATSVKYSSGILKDYQPNKPTQSSYEGATCNFVPNYVPIAATPPA